MADPVSISTDAQAAPNAPAQDRAGAVRRWIDRIEQAEKEPRRHAWEARCRKVMRRYKDEREGSEGRPARRFALLWANQETLKPVVYARAPRPEVNRRFKDEDPVGRAASEVLERALAYALDAQDFDAVLRLCRDDFLLYARATAWVRYAPHMKSVRTPVTPLTAAPTPGRHPGSGPRVQPGAGPRTGSAVMRDLHDEAAPRGLAAGMTGEGGAEGDTATQGPEVAEDASAYVDAAGRVHEAASVRHDPETGHHVVEEVLDFEEVLADHVQYDDFIHPPVRTWAELSWAARRAFMTREELIDRFGEQIGRQIPLDWKQDPDAAGQATLSGEEDAEAKAAIYEVWDKRTKRALWLSKSWPQGLLDDRDDPLGLTGFFPFPRPMQGTTGTDSVIPVPDYVFYQDQAEEIDELTAKIGRLEKGLKCMGFYAGASGLDLSEMFAEGENRLVPVADWSTLKGDGGVSGLIEWWPLDQVVSALEAMVKMRAQLIQDVYQITGVADILRGASDPDETATAQGIKANWGAVRVRDKQKEIARFARDLIRLMGQVIAARFSTATLKAMTDMPLLDTLAEKAALQQQIALLQQPQRNQMAGPPAPAAPAQQSHVPQGGPGATGPAGGASPTPPPHAAAPPPIAPPPIPFELQRRLADPTWEEVGALLQDEAARQFRIEVETDSTIEPDEQAAKAAATEFIQAIGQYISSALPAVQAAPQLMPLIGETMKYLVRHYRAGRELEDIIDRIADSIAEAPPPAHADPQAGAQAASGAAQMLASQARMALAQVAQQKERREAFTDAQRLQLEQQKAQLDAWSAQNDPKRAFVDISGKA